MDARSHLLLLGWDEPRPFAGRPISGQPASNLTRLYRDHRPLPADRVLGLGERLELPRARPQRLPGTEDGEEDRSGADEKGQFEVQEALLRRSHVRLPVPLRGRRDRARGLLDPILCQVQCV